MKIEQTLELTQAELNEAINHAIAQVNSCFKDFTEVFKRPSSECNFYKPMDNTEWTNGFFTGEIWLAYELTGDEALKRAGLKHVESFMNRVKNDIVLDHHDLGFLYSPSCVAAYKILNDEKAKTAALLAAQKLSTRYQEKGRFIQAWGELGAKDNYRLIIDCLLNLPLLYWASETSGDPQYKEIAARHIETTLNVIVRENYSTFHTYFFDPETGKPTHGVSHQGNRNESAWARGQAWGVYGLALSYKYTKNPEYLELFRHVLDYFLTHLPQDLIPYWDFDFTDGSEEPRDSSASAIVVCGILEMAKYVAEEEAEKYRGIAKRLMKALVDLCSCKNPSLSNGQLMHSTYAKSTPTNGCRHSVGVDECTSWGDYFYFEALMRLQNQEWQIYW